MHHIFQNAQVTWNKMVHNKRHHFLAQFSIAFHMVWSVLLQVLAQKTTFWLAEILWQPIRSFYSMVFEANTRNKTEHTMWKGMENCARKRCLFLCTILFQVTWAFYKMWCDKQNMEKDEDDVIVSIHGLCRVAVSSFLSPPKKRGSAVTSTWIALNLKIATWKNWICWRVGKKARTQWWAG